MQMEETDKAQSQNNKHSDKYLISYCSAIEIKGFTFSRYSEGVIP